MNAEIYFPRNGKAFGQTSEKNFEDTLKKLNSMNVNVIYKTEVNLTADSITEALKVSESGEEKIGLIMIADALDEDDPDAAKNFFESIGIMGKVRRIETKCLDPEKASSDEDNDLSQKEKSGSKKKKKKKNKAQETAEEPVTELIDISSGEVTVEEKKLFLYASEYNNKLVALLPRHELLDSNFNSVLYTAAKKLVAPKKKNSFWKRFIPCAGDRPFDVIRKIILILAVCTFLVSSALLIKMTLIDTAIHENEVKGVRNLLVSTDEGANGKDKKPTDGSQGVLADFSKLLEANPDTVGWIKIPNTVIDYVVVKSPYEDDPEYYLYRDFYRNYSKYGTIFMDGRSELDSKNLIVHGHHMKDGSMFASIIHYSELDFYKQSPVIEFNTLYEKNKWKIISVFKTNTLEKHGPFFNYLRGDFSSDYDFLNFAYELRVRSIIDCPVDLNENDTIVTLSTCTYDMDDFRFVVVARKLRDGEDEKVDTSKAKLNPNPVYPEGWYKWYGGTRPTVTSFQQALNDGQITWYDGSGDWSEKDDNELKKDLIEGKENAVTMLTEAYDLSEYAEVQAAEIKATIAEYTEKINKAERTSEVNDLYREAKAKLDKIQTKAQIEEEESKKQASEDSEKQASEKELSDARSKAISEMKNSVAGVEYRVAQARQVRTIIEEYEIKIRNADSVSEIESLKDEAISELKNVKTNAQMNEEESRQREESRRQEESSKQSQDESSKPSEHESSEPSQDQSSDNIAEYQEQAVSSVEQYLNPDDYEEAIASVMRAIIAEYSVYIRRAESESEIDTLVAEAKSKLYSMTFVEDSSDDESSEEASDEI